jgi:peptide/nickel transport system substrate-binding protein
MDEEDRGMSQGPLSSCGHRNLPTARFCDQCGTTLWKECPRCSALNREVANFCGNCGVRLRDPLLEPNPAPDTSRATRVENETALGAGPPAAPNGETIERFEHMERLLEDRRRARRIGAFIGVATAVIGVGVLGAALMADEIQRFWSPRPESVSGILGVPSGSRPDAEVSRTTPPPIETPPRRVAKRDPFVAQITPLTRTDTPDAIGPQGPNNGSSPPPAAAKPPAVTTTEPRVGGQLTFIVPAEPPSFDAHREETFALIHPAAPHYNTLLRIDPFDKTGTRVVGDLAESWTVSPDKRTYVLKLRRGVKFHDGSEMTSRDVRATYEKIINPPPGVTSVRKGEYLEIETVTAPEPYIVAFKLKWPTPSFIHSLASPWNWIYKADILERDIRWYETHVMGTGPFAFVEYVKGSHWVGRRNPDYWDRGKPYLDGYRALFIRDDAAQAQAIRAERAHIQFRGFSPAQRDDIVRALGEKVTVQESPWNCGLVVAINHQKKPFSDRRVRRALSLALDRYGAARALSKTAIVREVAGVQVPGSPFATSPAELFKLAGYGRDIRESRAKARRLLAEAGVANPFSFVLKNRNIPMPYEVVGTWLVNQWREIGLKVSQETQESSPYFKDLRAGNFEVSTDFQCGYVVDPDLDLYKFQSQKRSDSNYGRYTDPVLDDLYVAQSRTVDPDQRRRHIRAFEKRLLDEEAHYIYTLQWHRIVPHSSRVRGWTITPSHYLNNQLDTVWLAP